MNSPKRSLILSLAFLLFLTGCGASTTGDEVEITEKLFIAQVNDIYKNPKDYMGKTIIIDGMYDEQNYNGVNYTSVYRKAPGCCGDDGKVGIEFTTDSGKFASGDWIEVRGVLEEYKDGEAFYLRLAKAQVDKKSERGAEFVQQ